MRIALASARSQNGETAGNLARMKGYMQGAKAQGAELVCFGESFLQGFDCLKWDYEPDQKMAVTLDSPEISDLCRWTEELGIDVLFGFIQREDETLYSSCALLGGGEVLHLYRRISQGWKERRYTDGHYREGTLVEPFGYRGKRCLIALCGDLWDYPERFAQNVDLLFWPVFVDFTPEEWEKSELEDYCRQAQAVCAHTLLVNSLVEGVEPAFGGCFHFADGRVKNALPMGKEGLLVTEV